MRLTIVTSNGIKADFQAGEESERPLARMIPYAFIPFLKSLKGENLSLSLDGNKWDLPAYKHDKLLAYLNDQTIDVPLMLVKVLSHCIGKDPATLEPEEEFVL
jgi:hypothetical protein